MREEQRSPTVPAEDRRSVDRISRMGAAAAGGEERTGSSPATTTLPRRFSYGYSLTPTTNSLTALDTNQRNSSKVQQQQQKIPESGARKVSRFLRPDFYDQPKETTSLDKEKKERELETQKVLKEIRDKRIKNRISMRRERSMSREKSEEGDEKMIKCKDLVEALTATTSKSRKLIDDDDKEEEPHVSRRIAINDDDARKHEDVRYSRLSEDARRVNNKPEEEVKRESYTSRLFQHRAKQENALLESKINEDTSGQSGLKSPSNKNKTIKSPLDSQKSVESVEAPEEKALNESKTTRNPFYGLKSPLDENKSFKSPLDDNKSLKSPLDDIKSFKNPPDDNKPAKTPLEENKTITPNVKTPTDDNKPIVKTNGNADEEIKLRETESLLQNVSDNIKNIESNVQRAGAVKKERVSKLIRPKSYPSENGTKSGQTSPTEQDNSDASAKIAKKTVKVKENGDTKPKQNGDSKLNETLDTEADSSVGQLRKFRASKDKTASVDEESAEAKAAKRLSLPEGKFVEDAQQEKSKLVKLKTKVSKTSKGESGKKVVSKLPEKSETADKSVLSADKAKTTSDTNINSKIVSSAGKYLKTSQSMELNSEKNRAVEKSLIGGKVSPMRVSNKSNENLDLVNGNYIPDSVAKSPVADEKATKKADFFKTVYSELNSSKTKKTQVNDGGNENGNKTSGRYSSNTTNVEANANGVEAEEGAPSKTKGLKLKKSTTQPAQSTTGKNKFLQSLEKKIEKLRSYSTEEKAAKPGGVETTIKRLREQSVPRNTEHITESTLIKRAVSVEDFSNVKTKALQPSRKSVTKILGLFKKYEDKSPKSPENVDPITMLDNIRESNIPMTKNKEKERPKSLQVNKTTSKLPVNAHRKSLSLEGREDASLDEVYTRRKSLGPDGRDDVKSPCSDVQRKYLSQDDVKSAEDFKPQRRYLSPEGNGNAKEDVKRKENSLLQRRSFSLEGREDVKVKRKSLEERDEAAQQRRSLISPEIKLGNAEETRKANGDERKIYEEPRKSYAQRKTANYSNNNDDDRKTERKNLKLDFSATQDLNLNRVSYTTDDNSALLSPFDETTSCDSWSVCSDFHHTQDLSSPLSPNGNTYSGDENDSVIDRIRRKSFYTRFNEKPKVKARKSLIGNYKDLDLYKDYKEKSLPRYKDYSGSRRSSGYLASSGELESSEYRPYVRSKSVSGGGEYSGGIPNRYQTYNPRRSNVSSFYGNEDGITEELNTTGLYKKYTSRLGSLSRASRSPSSDFQYIPHSHATSSPSSSHQYHHHQTTENGHTEHAV